MPDVEDTSGGHPRPAFFLPQARIENRPAEEPSELDAAIIRPGGDGDYLPADSFSQQGLPEGRALLRIVEREPVGDQPSFGFELHSRSDVKMFHHLRYGRPDLDLSTNLAVGGTPPREFLNRMKDWSDQKGELTRALYELRCAHENLELVVLDEAQNRIPWELLWLPAWPGKPGPEPGFLGAVLPVTRWIVPHGAFPEVMRPFGNTVPYRGTGPVLAAVATDMAPDEAMLREHFAVYPRSGDPTIASVEALFDNLTTEPGPFAIVYVAAHGTFSNSPEEFELGGFSLSDTSWYDGNLPSIRDHATLIFLNSCVSGLLGLDIRQYNDGALRGFVEVFLRSGAAGVLATTGAIGKDEARRLADDLFKRLKADPELSVSEGVRQIRAELLTLVRPNPRWFRSNLSEVDQDAVNRTLLPLLYPFMYVYFGSPLMMISPTEPPSFGGAGELAGTGGQA
jgi:hypothetical protein